MTKPLLISTLFTVSLSAFSMSNIQYLYGNFKGTTFLDTQNGPKQTITVEHYRTFEYGDMFAFADYIYTPKGLQFSGDKTDLYGEISPRLSLNRISGHTPSNTLIKEYYASFQYNGSDTYHAWLYGIGTDLNIPGFSVFGLNLYRKVQNIGSETYQLSANYYAPINDQWHFEGFIDWTENDLLTQNQLLFDFISAVKIPTGKVQAGTEWHYYHDDISHKENSVFQALIKYVW